MIVDECRKHGTFFDAGELEDVLAFVRSGGLLLARRRETEELAREARRLESMPASPSPIYGLEADPRVGLVPVEVELGVAFVR